ncbi:hypothetical protein C817_00663 [Dorea sp. 5-2]|nr:hypothetical protein C817_00663 [Dorea sp. 5-2]
MKTKQKNKSIYHWVILVCCILTLMFAYSTRFGLAQLFTAAILKETGFATSAYFLSTTIASAICVFTSPIAGKLLRGKYMRPVFLICCVGTMGFYACFGFCHKLWHFYLVGAFQGIFAMGACTIPVTVLITNWFEKNRGLMISIAMTGISIGGTILSPAISWAIGSFGWRKAYFILGAVSLCVLIPIAGFIVRRTPEEVGLLPYGCGETTVSGAAKKTTAYPASSWNVSLKEARKTPVLWLFVAAGFLIYFSSCILGHMSNYLQSVGFQAAYIAAFISIYSVVAIFGKLVLGHVFDRFGPKGGMLFGGGTFVLFLAAFLLVSGRLAVLYLAAVLYGFGTCIATVAIPIMTTSIFGAQHYSELYGFISAFTMTGAAIGSPAIGLIFDLTGSYRPALIVLIILTLLSIAAVFICTDMSRKKSEKENQKS